MEIAGKSKYFRYGLYDCAQEIVVWVSRRISGKKNRQKIYKNLIALPKATTTKKRRNHQRLFMK